MAKKRDVLTGKELDNIYSRITKPSKAEKQKLQLLSDGYLVVEIAKELGLNKNTINNQLTALREKLFAESNPHLVRIALRQGYIN